MQNYNLLTSDRVDKLADDAREGSYIVTVIEGKSNQAKESAKSKAAGVVPGEFYRLRLTKEVPVLISPVSGRPMINGLDRVAQSRNVYSTGNAAEVAWFNDIAKAILDKNAIKHKVKENAAGEDVYDIECYNLEILKFVVFNTNEPFRIQALNPTTKQWEYAKNADGTPRLRNSFSAMIRRGENAYDVYQREYKRQVLPHLLDIETSTAGETAASAPTD